MKENSDSKSKYAEEDIIKILQYLVDKMLWALQERFLADSRYSNKHELCPSHVPLS